VSKRAGSLYRTGRSRNWLKTKNPISPPVEECEQLRRAHRLKFFSFSGKMGVWAGSICARKTPETLRDGDRSVEGK
jgi:hypothetical protein